MSIKEIIAGGGGTFLILLLTLIQISPLKINPWSWIARTIGNALNKGLNEKLSNIEEKVNELNTKVVEINTKVNNLEEKVDSIDDQVKELEDKVDESERANKERDIVLCRARILRFGDEILHGQRHSKDHFDHILLDCTEYENYCREHPGFLNNITEHTMKLINSTYDKCAEEHSFL